MFLTIARVFEKNIPAAKEALLMTAILIIVWPSCRYFAKLLINKLGFWRQNTIVIGNGINAYESYIAINNEYNLGMKVCKIATISEKFIVKEIQDLSKIVEIKSFTDYEPEELRSYQCVIAVDADDSNFRDLAIRLLTKYRVKNIYVIPSMRGVPLFGLETSQFFSHELLIIHAASQLDRMLMSFIKRTFDILLSLLGIMLLSPFFIILSIILSFHEGHIFFSHRRVKKGGKEFNCYKFRTMRLDASNELNKFLKENPDLASEWKKTYKLKNDPRVTNIGKFLRKTSLDELPQLFNVLKGDMSLVGPRPIVKDELTRYKDQASYYLSVRPGITGLWQISGRSDVSYEERIYYDAWYVKNWSIWVDIVILLKTFKILLNRKGSY